MNAAPILYWREKSVDPPEGVQPFTSLRSHPGPGTGTGLLYSMFGGKGKAGIVIAYEPENQRWQQVDDTLWIGADKNANPEQFARPKVDALPVFWVRLGDGNQWSIPVINPEIETCSLPVVEVLKRGVWGNEVIGKFSDIANRCAEIHGKLVAGILDALKQGVDFEGLPDYPKEKMRQLAIDVLNISYDLTAQEMSVLHLLREDAYFAVVESAMDISTIVEIVNDMEAGQTTATPFVETPGGGNSEPGGKAGGFTT